MACRQLCPYPPASDPACAAPYLFSVTAMQKGISLPALQRLLGHDRLTTTEIYLNLSPMEVMQEFQQKW
jgi:integrase/recombinase XerD